MNRSVFNRYAFFIANLLLFLGSLGWLEALWGLTLISGTLSAIGIRDLLQVEHAVRRNYPILGNLRYLVESIRPEIRQYLLESDKDEVPFSRAQRSLVYRRAKNLNSDKPFGTLYDVYSSDYEFLGHTINPQPARDPSTFRIKIGGPLCKQPYSASIFNISAMSFGALSANAIQALNLGAQKGKFIHDTGEGAISPYHLKHGGDLTWQIGSGYFGCRDQDGHFDPQRFAEKARLPQVKMIEIKLSQGAKPGHGGILPKQKITEEIARTREIRQDQDCVSPAGHSTFSTPLGLLEFISELRELSGGKPIGFKLCVGHPWEFMGIAKAMLQTGIYPDFIVVDGKEGGTGAAPVELTNHIGLPLYESLLLVHNVLVGTNLRQHIRLGASGKAISAFDIASVMAMGADWVNSARAFMFAIGCIQSQSCHTNRCPTGVATQDPARQHALVVSDKADRVYHYHRNTLRALSEMLASAGLEHPEQLTASHIAKRVSGTEIRLLSQLHTFLEPGDLLQEEIESDFYRKAWNVAQAESFKALELHRLKPSTTPGIDAVAAT